MPILRPFPGDELRALIELVNGQLDGENLHPPEPWRLVGTPGQPPFLNGWVNYGAGGVSAAFARNHLGEVRLRGLVKSGTVGGAGVIFTLPPVFAPTEDDRNFAVPSNGAFGWVTVRPNGDVLAQGGSNVWLALDGISFRR